jgi:HAD superfamily hydrolase (TIGR01450 family)
LAIDLDGVVYQGKSLVSGSDQAIRQFRQAGLAVFFVTNSSVRTRREVAEKLAGMGIPCRQEEVLTSAHAAAVFVARLAQGCPARVLAVGSDGLVAEMAAAGLSIVSTSPCEYVVVGMDTSFNYEKICEAMQAVLGGAKFVACNRDANFPVDQGRLMPGCGAMVSAIEAACGTAPHHVVGKPGVLMLELLSAEGKLKPEEILVVGDGVDSDIGMACAFGSPSVLIRPKGVPSSVAPVFPRPSYMTSSLAELPGLLIALSAAGIRSQRL